MIEVNTKIGSHKLVNLLGENNFIFTYLSEDPDGNKVVLRIFKDKKWLKEDYNQIERPYSLILEGRLSNKANLAFYEGIGKSEEINGRKFAYVVREYVLGKNIREIINKKLLWKDICSIIEGTCEALRQLHSIGLVHGGICPENIFVFGDRVKITDFALSITNFPDERKHIDKKRSFYLAPELKTRSLSPTNASDIYSVGALFYFLISGEEPDRELPKDIHPLIKKALQKEPTSRHENIEQFWGEIKKIIPEEEIEDEKRRKSPSLPYEIQGLAEKEEGIGYRVEKKVAGGSEEKIKFVIHAHSNLKVCAEVDESLRQLIQVSPSSCDISSAQKQEFEISVLGDVKLEGHNRGNISLAFDIRDDQHYKVKESISVSIIVHSASGIEERKGDGGGKSDWKKGFWLGIVSVIIIMMLFILSKKMGIIIPSKISPSPQSTHIKSPSPEHIIIKSASPKYESVKSSPEPSFSSTKLKVISLLEEGDCRQAKEILLSKKQNVSPSEEKEIETLLKSIDNELSVRINFRYFTSDREIIVPLGVSQRISLKSGDAYYLSFSSNDKCYLYFCQVDSQGKVDWLFPNDEYSKVGNPIVADEVYWFPSRDSCLSLDENPGSEKIYFVASRFPASDLESLLKEYKKSSKRKAELSERLIEKFQSRKNSGVGGCFYREMKFEHI